MAHVNPQKVGLLFAIFTAFRHLVWSVIVAAGAGQAVIDFLSKLHFLGAPEEKVQPFNFGTALSLITVTAFLSYLSGWALAKIWNHLQLGTKKPAQG